VGRSVLKLAHVLFSVNTGPMYLHRVGGGSTFQVSELEKAVDKLPAEITPKISKKHTIFSALVGLMFIDNGLRVLPDNVGIDVAGDLIQKYTPWKPKKYYPNIHDVIESVPTGPSDIIQEQNVPLSVLASHIQSRLRVIMMNQTEQHSKLLELQNKIAQQQKLLQKSREEVMQLNQLVSTVDTWPDPVPSAYVDQYRGLLSLPVTQQPDAISIARAGSSRPSPMIASPQSSRRARSSPPNNNSKEVEIHTISSDDEE
jgi:uncharacterized coiled-coil protein SlyX